MQPEHWLFTIPLRLRSLFRRAQVDQELDDELCDHLERKAEQYMAQGMTQGEARRRARLDLGGIDQTKEKCRDARGVNWAEDLRRDLRHGVRVLRQNPGFAAVAIFTIALAIGANTAIFSADDAVLFRILPYKQPERLVEIFQKYVPHPETDRMPVAPANYRDWQTNSRSFESLAAYRLANFNLSGNDNPERVRAAQISTNTFSTLGVAPVLGRDFQTGEDANGSGNVAILSCRIWQRRFAADKGIIGKTIRANDQPYMVIGVMPPGFRFPIGWLRGDVEIWTPLVLDTQQLGSRKDIILDVVGRLRPGVSVNEAQADLNVVSQQLAQAYPDTNKDWGTNVMSLTDRGVSDYRGLLTFLSLSVGLVLLIASANVANLLLARGIERQRELTVRSALGAQRSRLVRQLIAEGVLLAFVGGLVGIAFAFWGVHILALLAPTSEMPDLKHVSLNAPLLVFSCALSIVAGLLFSLFPALTLSNFSLHATLQETGRTDTGSVRRNRLKTGLVIGEMALTLALVLCSGAVLKSFIAYMSIDPGFDPHNVLTMRMVLPMQKYKQPQQWAAFFERVVEEIQTIPGVSAAAVGSGAPMEGAGSVMKYNVGGKPSAEKMDSHVIAEYMRVTPDYLRATGIRLLRGRSLATTDREGTPAVALVNEEFVKREFGNQNPIGQRIILHGDVNKSVGAETNRPPLEIVGVVNDTKEYGLYHITPVMIYVPLAQDPQSSMAVLVRIAGEPESVLPEIHRRLLRIDPDQPVYNIRSLEAIFQENHSLFRFNTLLLTVFATIALLLSLIGIYGVIAYAVGQRTREFGVRMALGSRPSQILVLVLRQGAWMSAVGVLIGLALSWPAIKLLARSLKSSMYLDLIGTGLTVPILACAATVLVMVLAILIPARRATKIDPMEALRFE